jgi:putative endonuclease
MPDTRFLAALHAQNSAALSSSTESYRSSSSWFVYILRCSDGTLYAGSTNDLTAREHRHNNGRGAKYTAGRRPVRLVYSERHESRSAAQTREAQIKRWSRPKKEALVAGRLNRLRHL